MYDALYPVMQEKRHGDGVVSVCARVYHGDYICASFIPVVFLSSLFFCIFNSSFFKK